MFERYSGPSKAVLVEAQELAVELGSGYISVGHLFYGCAEVRDETAGQPLRDCGITSASVRRLLPRTPEQPAGQPAEPAAGQVDPEALRAIGIDYDGVRAAVEARFGPGALDGAPDRRVPSSRTRRPPFTPNAKRSIELALRAAEELHQHQIVPGHLLLGLLRLDNDLMSSLIEESGTSVAAISAAVLAGLAAAA